MFNAIRRIVIGDPLASSRARQQRVGLGLAFVIVSANALSSVAYASEALVSALLSAGEPARSYIVPISLAVVGLMGLVVLHYYHVIRTYPTGGGAYVVARENLGVPSSVIAAASLLMDYVLTVAVSVTAGVAALSSAFPRLASYQVLASLLLIIGLMIINLRGTRQSALMLGLPIYLFVVSIAVMLGTAMYRYYVQGYLPDPSSLAPVKGVGALGFVLLLRAFSSGCVALTGVEAISNTLGIFRPPEIRNARITLVVMGLVLGSLFMGISLITYLFHLEATSSETLMSQVARVSFGTGVFYYLVQVSTLMILVVAANTSFSSFPLLSAHLARDGFLPRPFSNLGERLVYSNGIVLLSGAAILLIVVFNGDLHQLLPLYAIGVFLGFMLSGLGMARYWWRTSGWRFTYGTVAASVGAAVTGTVLGFLAVSRFSSGAWIAAVAILALAVLLIVIRNHYRSVARALSLRGFRAEDFEQHKVVVIPVGGVHRAVLPALEYAKSIGTDIRAVHVAVEEEAALDVQARWDRLSSGIPLTIISSPYREVVEPLFLYVTNVADARPSERVTVVVPEFVPKRWWERLLHNQTASLIKRSLARDRRIVVVSMPYYFQA